jgi:nucleoside-diphosphate-sugar epimerase
VTVITKRVLFTGACGFIGSSLIGKLSKKGYQVWGIDKQKSSDDRIVSADLLSYESTRFAFSKIPRCDILIHTAALAHSENIRRENRCFHTNNTITKNVIRVSEANQPHFIFLSSVAVYGEDRHNTFININEKLRPSTEYGKSKVSCEKIIQNSKLKKYHILRLAPVFDDDHLKDLKKRVYFPKQSKFKMRIIPSPQYDFCHIQTLSKTILDLIEKNYVNSLIMNITDHQPYDQNLLSKQFSGIEIPVPVKLLMPVYYLSLLLPPKSGYSGRCLFWKLFRNNLYI